MENNKFDYIRSYRDNEAKGAITKLMKYKEFHYILNKIYPGVNIEEITRSLQEINSISDFQANYVCSYNDLLINKTMDKFTHISYNDCVLIRVNQEK